MENYKKYLWIVLIPTIFIVGFVFGKSDPEKITIEKKPEKREYRERYERKVDKNSNWSLINPLLDCESFETISNQTSVSIKQKVESFIEEQKSQEVETVSVYYRDLNNGPWFGIEEKTEFNPGSLLKVPIMMRIFKDMEQDHTLLDRTITVKGQPYPFVQYFKPDISLEFGKTYTIAGLISLMIVNSNNDATKALEQFIGNERLYQIYEELGVKKPSGGQYSVSVREYASFFRILFNASYLTNNYSEKALKLLSGTTFDSGLRAGVPSNIPIAHKFGERTEGGFKQLHNCGIVYYPEKPYILCVMTRGKDFDKLASVIAQISKVVYEGVSKP